MVGGGFGLYQAGLIKLSPEPSQQVTSALSAAESKISDLEKKLGDVTSSISSQSSSSDLSKLESKVSSLEAKLQDESSSDLSATVDALKKDVEGLRSTVASSGGGSSTGEGVPAADLQPLESRVAALEDNLKSDSQVDLAPLETRLAKLETSASSTSSEADKLSGSVTGLEGQLSDLKSTISDVETRLSNTEATAKAAQTAVSTSDVSLKTLADSQARATDTLSSLAADIKSVGAANKAALEGLRSELDSISSRLAAVEATMGDATAREVAARALSVSALKSAVDSGRPYETELAAVKAGLPGDLDLSALEANAKTGVEPVPVLIAQFPPVARSIYQTFSEPDRSGDMLDSLVSSAQSLFTVRRSGSGEGDGPAAALQRMENAVNKGDLKKALVAYKDLPEQAQAAGADWATRAEARVEVDDLTNKASQEVLNALAAKDS